MSPDEQETKLMQMRGCVAFAEKAYDEMYETSSKSGATAYYSEAKESYYQAIALAKELGLETEAAAFSERLDHIKAVFRSQFT